MPQNPSHDVLASRALVRACLRQWDAALDDAEKVSFALLSYTLTMLENDIVMSSSLFMLITYYSVLTDTNERD